MNNLYLVTDENDRISGGKYWFPGATHRTSGKGALFGPGWIQCYRSSILAAFLTPIYDGFENGHLWLCTGSIGIYHHDIVFGASLLTARRRVLMPELSVDQRIRLAILTSRQAFREIAYIDWTGQWLDSRKLRNLGGQYSSHEEQDRKGIRDASPKLAESDQGTLAKESAFLTTSAILCPSSALIPALCAGAVTRAAAANVKVLALANQVHKST